MVAEEKAGLRGERELLDRARESMVRGDLTDTLAILATHASRFPQAGTLTEEREALRIRAAVRRGHADEARRLLSGMRTRFPNSFLLPGAEADVASIP